VSQVAVRGLEGHLATWPGSVVVVAVNGGYGRSSRYRSGKDAQADPGGRA
jgi:hypothetical protein